MKKAVIFTGLVMFGVSVVVHAFGAMSKYSDKELIDIRNFAYNGKFVSEDIDGYKLLAQNDFESCKPCELMGYKYIKTNKKCKIFDALGTVQMELTTLPAGTIIQKLLVKDDWIKIRISDEKAKFPDSWIKRCCIECGPPKYLVVIDEVEKRKNSKGILEPPSDLHPVIPVPVCVNHVDCGLIKDCYQNHRYDYELIEVEQNKNLRSRLNMLRDTSFYGCHKIDNTIRCRFSRALKIDQKKSIDDIFLFIPDNWTTNVDPKEINEIWVEAGITVDSDGFPIARVSEDVRPIALRTKNKYYLAKEKYMPGKYDKGKKRGPEVLPEISYDNKVFVISNCGNERSTCENKAENIIETLLKELESSFSKPKISADKIMSHSFGSGQLKMRRVKKESEVLGLPSYETSQYLINLKIVNYNQFEKTIEIQLQIESCISIGPGAESNKEGLDKGEKAEYDKEIKKIVGNVLDKICTEKYNVERNGGPCIIKGGQL